MNVIGYEGVFGPETGKYVEADRAFEYALKHLPDEDEEAKKDFVEWFFSGNWIKVREE